MTPFGRLGVFVLACAALLGVALFTDIHHDPPVLPATSTPPVHWGTADEWAALLAANTTTTTAPPEPVTEPVTTTPTPGFRQTPTNHEDESPPLGGSTAGAGTWDCIRARESGGLTDTNGNYSEPGGGAYQITDGTLHGMGYSGQAQNYSPAQQDAMAMELYNARGFQPWATASACGVG